MLMIERKITFTNSLEAPPRWLTRPTYYVNRRYNVLALLMFIVEFQYRSNAELI